MSLQTDERYQKYLQSRKWAEKRNAVKKRCGNICERCHRNPVDLVHHLTYVRLYDELPTDIAGWCNGCHEYEHGHSDIDPATLEGFTAPNVLKDVPAGRAVPSGPAVKALLAAGQEVSDEELMARYAPPKRGEAAA